MNPAPSQPTKPAPQSSLPTANPYQTGQSANPFSSPPSSYPSAYGSSYGTPAYGGQPYGQQYNGQPHRGGLVLTFGILSLVFSLVGVACVACAHVVGLPMPLLAAGFSLPAILMGSKDLKRIKTNQMDPSGQSMTLIGLILGWVGGALAVLEIVVAIGFLIFIIVMVANSR
jgi:hypothetical protein